ncbi:MAG: hypothetical protein H0X69_03600 [Gemmatimonadales bacterium]|nr:hypothetical protein [Gemmatimonadales bacterium]
MIELHTLGVLDLRATDGGEVLAVLQQPKRLGLLAYLAAEAQRSPYELVYAAAAARAAQPLTVRIPASL